MKSPIVILAAIAAAVAAGVLPGIANAAELIVDGGFEQPIVTTPGQFQSGYSAKSPGQAFGGPGDNAWTVVGRGGDIAITSSTEFTSGPTLYNGHSGLQWIDLTGTQDNGAAVGIAQTVATTVGATYDLSFWIGSFVFDAAPSSVDLVINGVSAGLFTNPTRGVSPGNGIGWKQFNTTLVGTGSDTVAFIYASGGSANGLDDVSLLSRAPVGGVPEPASWALMLMGFGGLGAALRRRRAAGPLPTA